MNIVLDTNVLVSALWSADSKPAIIINGVLSRRFTACYDYRIISEYYTVLKRPKFHFEEWEIQSLLAHITSCAAYHRQHKTLSKRKLYCYCCRLLQHVL